MSSPVWSPYTDYKPYWLGPFRAYITSHIDLHLRIKQRSELDDATHHITILLRDAAWHSSPPPRTPPAPVHATPLHIRNLVTDKRRARSRWQRSPYQGDRAIYRLKRNLQAALRDARNATFTNYITSLSQDDTSFWKATKGFKRPQVSIPPVQTSNCSWAKQDMEKATALGNIFARCSRRSSFHPHDLVVSDSLDVSCLMSLPITPFSPAEVSAAIARLNVRKELGYDFISLALSTTVSSASPTIRSCGNLHKL